MLPNKSFLFGIDYFNYAYSFLNLMQKLVFGILNISNKLIYKQRSAHNNMTCVIDEIWKAF